MLKEDLINPLSGNSFSILKPSPFGHYAVIWSVQDDKPVIERILLSSPEMTVEKKLEKTYPGLNPHSCGEIDGLTQKIDRFLHGEPTPFDLAMIRISRCPSFQQKILTAEYQVHRGCVTTYGRLAVHIHHPRAIRAAGHALASNPFPIIIPCHRAVRSDFSLGGYQGGLPMKQKLLEYEGLMFDSKTRIIQPKLHY